MIDRLRRRRVRAAVAIVAGALAAAGCSSSGHAAGAGSTAAATAAAHRSTGAAPVSAVATNTTSATGQPGGRAQITVTGAITISASGTGASCAYFYPGQRQGVSYAASSTTLHGTSSTGGWNLSITNDDGHHLSVLLNTDRGSWGIPASGPVGTVHANADLHHADFDVDIHKVVSQLHAHLSGHIDCP